MEQTGTNLKRDSRQGGFYRLWSFERSAMSR
jgi:hypothetical protein